MNRPQRMLKRLCAGSFGRCREKAWHDLNLANEKAVADKMSALPALWITAHAEKTFEFLKRGSLAGQTNASFLLVIVPS
jgi:hypothetical protein